MILEWLPVTKRSYAAPILKVLDRQIGFTLGQDISHVDMTFAALNNLQGLMVCSCKVQVHPSPFVHVDHVKKVVASHDWRDYVVISKIL